MMSDFKNRSNDASWLVQVTMIDKKKNNGIFMKGGGMKRLLGILNNQSASYYYRGLAARTLAYILKMDPTFKDKIQAIDTTIGSLIYLINEAESQSTISKNDAIRVRLNAIMALTLVTGERSSLFVDSSFQNNQELLKMNPYPEYAAPAIPEISRRPSMFQPTRVSMYASSALHSSVPSPTASPNRSSAILPPSSSSHLSSPQHATIKPLTPNSTTSSTSSLVLPSINNNNYNNNNQSFSTIDSEPTTPKFLPFNSFDAYKATHNVTSYKGGKERSYMSLNELKRYDEYMAKKIELKNMEKSPYGETVVIVPKFPLVKIQNAPKTPQPQKEENKEKDIKNNSKNTITPIKSKSLSINTKLRSPTKPLRCTTPPNIKKINQAKAVLFFPYKVKNINVNKKRLLPADILLDQLNPPNQRSVIPAVLINQLKIQKEKERENNSYPIPDMPSGDSLPYDIDKMILYDTPGDDNDEETPDWVKRVNIMQTLHKSTDMLSKILKNVTKSVKKIENRIDTQIITNKKNLPLKFLFEKAGDAYYCRTKLTKIIIKWGLYQIYSLKRKAFYYLVKNMKRVRYVQNCQLKSLTMMDNTIKRSRNRKVDKYFVFCFQKWKTWVDYLVKNEQLIAAVLFQKIYRGYKDRKLFKKLRRKYYAARNIQTLRRKYVCRKRYLTIRHAIIVLQSFARMIKPLKNYKKVRGAIIKIQALARMMRSTKTYDKMKLAAMMLHMNVRCYLSKQKAKQLIKDKMIRKELNATMAHKIQMAYRGWVGRRRVNAIRKYNNFLNRCAMKIQRCYFRHIGDFSSFVLIRCLTISDLCDKLKSKIERKNKRNLNAKKIQRFYKFHHQWKIGLKNAPIWRLRYKSGKIIENFIYITYHKRDNAARSIQRVWLHEKPGRMMRYLHRRVIKMREEEERELYEKQNKYIIKIQRAYHHFRFRRYMKRITCVRLLQRIIKGYLARLKRLNILRMNVRYRSKKLIKFIIPMKLDECTTKTCKIMKVNIIKIQKIIKMYLRYKRYIHEVEYKELLNRKANIIEKNYRRFIDRRNLRRHIRLNKTRKTGLYRDRNDIRDIISSALKDIQNYYSPTDELVGMRLPMLLRRLGLHSYVVQFQNNGCNSIEQLRTMSETELEQCGITEEYDKNNISGLFQHSKPIMLGIGLISTEDDLKKELLRVFPNRKVRSINFAKQAILAPELSFLCVRRFLRKYVDNVGMIKNNIEEELIKWENADSEIKYENERLQVALNLFTSACLRISDLCPNISMCREAGRIAEAVENIPMNQSLVKMYNILHKLYIDNNKVIIIQRFMSRYLEWKKSQKILKQLRRDKILYEYISYYKVDRVRKAWDKMVEEDNTRFRKWMEHQERNRILSQLVMVSRYGWSKALNKEKKVYFLNKETNETSPDRVIYTIPEFKAVVVIQSVLRMKLAKNRLQRNRRKYEERRKRVEKAKEYELESNKQKRSQLISIKYNYKLAINSILPTKEEGHVGREAVGRKLRLLMWNNDDWPDVRESIADRMESERLKRIADNNSAENQISKYKARILQLKKDIDPLESMLDYYQSLKRSYYKKKNPKKQNKLTINTASNSTTTLPAVVPTPARKATNSKNLSKTIGQRLGFSGAKGIPPVSEFEVSNMLLPIKTEYNEIMAEIRQLEQDIRVRNESSVMIIDDKTFHCESDNHFRNALVMDYDKRTRRHLLLFDTHFQKWVDLRNRYYEWLDSSSNNNVSIKFEYTFVAPRYGYWYHINPKTHEILYYNINTHKYCQRIEYNYYEIFAIIEIQRIYRGYRDRKMVKNKINNFYLSKYIKECIRRGTNIAWIGYYKEGLDCEMYLNRLGLSYIKENIKHMYKDDEIIRLTLEGKVLERNVEIMRRQQLLKKKGMKITLESDNIYYTRPDSDLIYHNNRDPSIKLQVINNLTNEKLEHIGVNSSQNRLRIMSCLNDKDTENFSLSIVEDNDHSLAYLPKGKTQLMDGPRNLFLINYPKYPHRVNEFLKNLNEYMVQCNNHKISIGQLIGLFDEYPRIPPNLGEITAFLNNNKYIVSTDEDIHSLYILYHNSLLRSIVYISLMKIDKLKDILMNGKTKVDEIYLNQTPKDAAVYIRKLFDRILAFDEAVVKVQCVYRGYIGRRIVKGIRQRYSNAVTRIASFWRCILSKKEAEKLHKLYYAEWEEQFHPFLKRKYYKHLPTGETRWEKPIDVPVRPYGMWPNLRRKMVDVPEGKCCNCHKNDSVYECEGCGNNREYCFNCYALIHEQIDNKQRHIYHICKSKRNKDHALRCIQCNLLATILCEDCDGDSYCLEHFKALHKSDNRKNHKYIKFVPGASVCSECESKIAIRQCEDCEDSYCIECYDRIHKKGKRINHKYKLLKDDLPPGYRYCSICSVRATNQICLWCARPLCDTCIKFEHVPDKCSNKPPSDSILYILKARCCGCNKPASRHCVECNKDYCMKSEILGVPSCCEKYHDINSNIHNHQIEDHPRAHYESEGRKIVRCYKKYLFRKYINNLVKKTEEEKAKKKAARAEHDKLVNEMRNKLKAIPSMNKKESNYDEFAKPYDILPSELKKQKLRQQYIEQRQKSINKSKSKRMKKSKSISNKQNSKK